MINFFKKEIDKKIWEMILISPPAFPLLRSLQTKRPPKKLLRLKTYCKALPFSHRFDF